MQLRGYQQRIIDELYSWFRAGNKGNPCVVAPTGSGKSLLIADLCTSAIKSWPKTRILLLSHVKEILQQDAEKITEYWPNAPVGIYSSGLGRREADMPITVASIQTVHRKAQELGHIDLVVIDECHTVSHKNKGTYRKLINELAEINPLLRVIGFTATPFRMGHGLISTGTALFSDIIDVVGIGELISMGYLSPLKSRMMDESIDVSDVRQQGGDYVTKELSQAVDKSEINESVTDEIVKWGENRKSWLIFCVDIGHAEHIATCLNERGIPSESVHSKKANDYRDEAIKRFKSGETKALTSVATLTTGFDHPGVDLIAMVRPTQSPALYMQMVGRGLRVAPGKDDCAVLDFTGNIATHGPITDVKPPEPPGGGGEAPVRVCYGLLSPHTGQLVYKKDDKGYDSAYASAQYIVCNYEMAPSVRFCPSCGHPYPRQAKDFQLHQDDIMGNDESKDMTVGSWLWRIHTSKNSGRQMIKCNYYSTDLSKAPIVEYVPLFNGGNATRMAIRTLKTIVKGMSANRNLQLAYNPIDDLARIAQNYSAGGEADWDAVKDAMKRIDNSQRPAAISYRREGHFNRITDRRWTNDQG